MRLCIFTTSWRYTNSIIIIIIIIIIIGLALSVSRAYLYIGSSWYYIYFIYFFVTFFTLPFSDLTLEVLLALDLDDRPSLSVLYDTAGWVI